MSWSRSIASVPAEGRAVPAEGRAVPAEGRAVPAEGRAIGGGSPTGGDDGAIGREGPNQFLLPGVFALSELLCPLCSPEEGLVGLDRRLGGSDRFAQFSRDDSRVQW